MLFYIITALLRHATSSPAATHASYALYLHKEVGNAAICGAVTATSQRRKRVRTGARFHFACLLRRTCFLGTGSLVLCRNCVRLGAKLSIDTVACLRLGHLRAGSGKRNSTPFARKLALNIWLSARERHLRLWRNRNAMPVGHGKHSTNHYCQHESKNSMTMMHAGSRIPLRTFSVSVLYLAHVPTAQTRSHTPRRQGSADYVLLVAHVRRGRGCSAV